MITKIKRGISIPSYLQYEEFCKLHGLKINKIYSVDKQFIKKAIEMAKKSTRKRFIITLHKNLSDNTHRLINVLTKDTYAQPHKHINPSTSETFTTIKGSISVIEFNELGKVINRINIGDNYNDKIVEIKPNTIHTVIPITNIVVLLEIKGQTNYKPETDKYFYDWAPKEGDDPLIIKRYLKKINKLNV